MFTLFVSDQTTEPNEQQNQFQILNPSNFVFQSTLIDKNQRKTFAEPFLFLTILPSNDFKLRVTCKFKPEPKRKKIVNADPNDEQFLADLKKAQELANIEGDDRVGFTLGEGNAYQKKNRIQLQVQRLMDDPS